MVTWSNKRGLPWTTNRKFVTPVESIRVQWNTFLGPTIDNKKLFINSETDRKLLSPVESVRWESILWSPMEQFSWASKDKYRFISKSLTNRKLVTPVESIRCQWIHWSPMEHFPRASKNKHKLSLQVSNEWKTWPSSGIYLLPINPLQFSLLDFWFSNGTWVYTTGV